MKKLLVILLLLFPVHGAWAEEKIEEMFGLKFGQSCDEKNFAYRSKDYITEKEKFYEWSQPKVRYNVTPPTKNIEFTTYGIDCTVSTNKLYAIRASSDRDKCTWVKIDSLKKFLTKKYKINFKETSFQLSDMPPVSNAHQSSGTYNTVYIACGYWIRSTYLQVVDLKLRSEHKDELNRYRNLKDEKGL